MLHALLADSVQYHCEVCGHDGTIAIASIGVHEECFTISCPCGSVEAFRRTIAAHERAEGPQPRSLVGHHFAETQTTVTEHAIGSVPHDESVRQKRLCHTLSQVLQGVH